jgi:hypothetical protein
MRNNVIICIEVMYGEAMYGEAMSGEVMYADGF